jgi:uncharacterized OB-fold protein
VTFLLPHPVGIPVPNPSPFSEPFWDGCKRSELLYQRCSNGHIVFNPFARCRMCTSADLRWERSAGTGQVYSWSTVWRPQTPAFRVPYTAAIIELDEGYQMIANVIGCDHEDVHVGLRVGVEFHPISDEMSLAYFSPMITNPDKNTAQVPTQMVS